MNNSFNETATAAAQAGVPDGWQLVPITATKEMIAASDDISSRGEGEEHWAAMLAAAPSPPAAEPWKFVATDGQPEDGLYIAVYRDEDRFPIGLLCYGAWEFYDQEDEHEGADEDGMVRGFGWTEETEGRGESLLWVRDVVAYQPTNYAHKDGPMKALREKLKAMQPPTTGEAP